MSDESSEKPNTPHHEGWGALRETLGKAGEVAGGIPLKKWRQRKDKVHLIRRKEHVPKAEAEL